MLSQLFVTQSANAALALSTSQSSTCQPAQPRKPAAVQYGGSGGGEDIKNGRRRERKIEKKMRAAGMGCRAKDRKQFRAVRVGKAKALQIERPLPLIWTVFITSVGRHSHIAFHSLSHPWLQVNGKGNFLSAHVQAAPFLMDKLYFWNT